MDWTHIIAALLGALGVLGTAVLRAWTEARNGDHEFGSRLRDELRADLDTARSEIQQLRADLLELQSDRLELKRALNMRDHRIEILEARVQELENLSLPEELL